MSVSNLEKALEMRDCEEPVVRAFVDVWPVAEAILDSFAKATQLPLFVFLNGLHVFTSSTDTMPPFCKAMLSTSESAALCTVDGARRALDATLAGAHLCHAGLLNGRMVIPNPFFGELVVLYGSRRYESEEAAERQVSLLTHVDTIVPGMINDLVSALATMRVSVEIEKESVVLMEAIGGILNRLFEATVASRVLAITMAHELSQMFLTLGLSARALSESIPESSGVVTTPLINECRLGLYIVHNFLSHLSERKYRQVVRAGSEFVDLGAIVREMIELYQSQVQQKGASFELVGLETLPSKVRGHDLELRRAIHNILNNALKYSYHSVADARRTIRIRARVPYDPGFRQRRLALQFENYGLGLSAEEKRNALKPGFRGKQAIAEVPIGSGIGLSEVAKIMKAHHGEVKFDSRELHPSRDGTMTYLTTVDLILPY